MIESDIPSILSYYESIHTSAVRLSSANPNYNCHSYAWYSTSTNNPYWMNDPSKYWTDGSYIEQTSASSGDKIVYYENGVVSHSGVVNSDGTVTSKWGWAPVYKHDLLDCPYTYYGTQKYYDR